MIAATVLLDARTAIGTVFGVGRDVVGRFGVIFTFGFPHLDHLALSGSMVVIATLETIFGIAFTADHSLRFGLVRLDDCLAFEFDTATHCRMGFDALL